VVFEVPSSFNSYTNVFTLAAGDRIYFSTVGHPSSGTPGWHQVGVEAVIQAPFPAGLLQFSSATYSQAEGDSGTPPPSSPSRAPAVPAAR